MLVAESYDLIGFCDLIPSRDPNANPQTVGEIAALYVLHAIGAVVSGMLSATTL